MPPVLTQALTILLLITFAQISHNFVTVFRTRPAKPCTEYDPVTDPPLHSDTAVANTHTQIIMEL